MVKMFVTHYLIINGSVFLTTKKGNTCIGTRLTRNYSHPIYICVYVYMYVCIYIVAACNGDNTARKRSWSKVEVV